MYSYRFSDVKLRKGAHFADLRYRDGVEEGRSNASFSEVIRQLRTVPAGAYYTEVKLLGSDGSVYYSTGSTEYIDTLLPERSGLKASLEHQLSRGVQAATAKTSRKANSRQIEASQRKVNRSLRPVKGMESRTVHEGDKDYTQIYYKEFLIGKYELSSLGDLKEKISNGRRQLEHVPGAGVATDLNNFSGVSAQMRELGKGVKNESRYKGYIDVSTNRANAQDPQSVIDQNYSEVQGSLDVELMGVPFNVEGFYTSQDANRKAKASYLRFHYDVQTAKEKLQQRLNAYQSKLKETMGKGAGMESVYGSYANSLRGQKTQLLHRLVAESGIDSGTLSRHNGDLEKAYAELEQKGKDSLGNGADSSTKLRYQRLQERKEKTLARKADFEKRYRSLEDNVRKAEHYERLLENYRNKTMIDSAIMAERSKYLGKGDPSYKDLSKSAVGILPEGNTKKFLTGLTHFDAGIINKYESAYTMSGQNLKGFSVGYDAGAVRTGLTLGSTEYVSRDGNVDHYSTMLLRVDNHTAQNHKFSLLYNLTMPAKTMMSDNQFIGKNGATYPSFRSPTQIPSFVYDGKLGKYLTLHTEAATSIKYRQQQVFDMEHSAINGQADFQVPKTSILLKAGWEHLGRSFENNTLPYIRSGTERYTLGTSFDLFKGFLSTKLDYNFLVQQNLSSNAYSRKWGIDLKTHSRRYPSVGISYKPFSTFRSASDTLSVPQRPVQGEVWTVRSSYQIKRHKIVHRFTALWNRNKSTADTLQYVSATLQLGYVLSLPKFTMNASLGRIDQPANYASGDGVMSSYTAMLGVQQPIGKQWNVNLGPSIAWTDWGVQRLATTAGVSWAMQAKPLTVRLQMRYSRYRMNATEASQELYVGQLGINYRFNGVYRKKSMIESQ
ncbi:hypothetical protein GCM10023092_16220 [Rurimicrobium arvi]|uniref:Outer membrane protein beta-barrel domain-containing protein n=1 Tax=Rurimicrobium arvi TaxID=2049916 RepID=A0ABP8MTI0_9BACT